MNRVSVSWVGYQSNESGQDEIYVRPFPDANSGRWQVSTGGGTRPLWARSGKELFYEIADDALDIRADLDHLRFITPD